MADRPRGGKSTGRITPGQLDYVLRPNHWIGMQLDFRVRNPCTPWAQTIYDRTVELVYTQVDRVGHVQEIPMVPLTITRRGGC